VTLAVLGQYTYDAMGRRVRKVAGGTTTLYFYDAAGHLVESQDLSTTPATRRSYVFVEDEPMGVVDQPASGAPVFSWIHTDRLGTPLAVTSTPGSGSAQVIWRATYEPFGLATPDEDPDGDLQSFVLDLRFPGQVFDPESGGHDNRFRHFDPKLGRYITTDPLGQYDSSNLFTYAFSDPLNQIDPYGLAVPAAIAACASSPPCASAVAAGIAATAVAVGNLARNLADDAASPPPPDFGDGDGGDGGNRISRCISAARRCLDRLNPDFPLDDLIDSVRGGPPCTAEPTEQGRDCLRALARCLQGQTTIFPGGGGVVK
jgi:RHS repeat-associated protein